MHKRPWLADAACRKPGVDIRWFYPREDTDAGRIPDNAYDAGRVICAQCPAIQSCLQSAMERREPHGLWGGKSPGERAAMVRQGRRIHRRAS